MPKTSLEVDQEYVLSGHSVHVTAFDQCWRQCRHQEERQGVTPHLGPAVSPLWVRRYRRSRLDSGTSPAKSGAVGSMAGGHPVCFRFHAHLPHLGSPPRHRFRPVCLEDGLPSDSSAPVWLRWATLSREMRRQEALPPLALGYGSSKLGNKYRSRDPPREWRKLPPRSHRALAGTMMGGSLRVQHIGLVDEACGLTPRCGRCGLTCSIRGLRLPPPAARGLPATRCS